MKPVAREVIARIRAQIDDRTVVHPEIATPVTFVALRAILAREHVELVVRPHPRLAELVPILGRWTIIVDSSTSEDERLALVSHELGHLWLHHDPFFDRHETHVYDSGCPWYDEQRELEANVFADLFVAGRSDFPPTGKIERFVNGQRVDPAKNSPGILTIPADAFDRALRRAIELEEESKRFRIEHRVVRRRKRAAASPDSLLAGRSVSTARTADDDQITFFDEAKGLPRFRDDGGMHWWITNLDESGERIGDFMSIAIARRVFENAAGVRKVYQFRDANELRAYKVKHLERQLREARWVDG